jgi:hypothetical protein
MNAANAFSLQASQLIFSSSVGINQLSVHLKPVLTSYTEGMVVNIKITETNTGPVTIRLNDLPFIPLKKDGEKVIDSADLYKGQIITVIFDGVNFQLLSKIHKTCPSGFIEINKDFCMEVTDRDTVDWFQAVKTCGDLNARLCTQGEWAYACLHASQFNLIKMTDNLEWIDSAGNSPDQCKAMGIDAFGYIGCNAGASALWNAKENFRCCYSK